MKKYSLMLLFTASYIFTNNAISHDIIQCDINNIQCLKASINSAKTIELKKIEVDNSTTIEETQIIITNKDQFAEKKYPTLSDYGKEKSMQGTADISIHKLQAIKKDPKNSIFKELIQTCPDLNKNLEKLKGKTAQCLLNENIIVHYQSHDIYWCEHSDCMLGSFPEEGDERLQLVANGLSKSYRCNGSLIDEVKLICKMDRWETSDYLSPMDVNLTPLFKWENLKK